MSHRKPGPPSCRKHRIWKRDKYICYICLKKIPKSEIGKDDSQLTVDHIKPLFLGGTNALVNLATCCRKCNLAKGRIEESSKGKIYRKHARIKNI